MYVHCPHCGTYAEMRRPADQIRCAFCHYDFQPTKLDLLRYRRMQEAERRRQQLAPLNLWGSIVATVITALLLLGISYHGAPGNMINTVSIWAFPFWITLLTVGVWWMTRSRHTEHLPALHRTSVMLLLALMLPLLYSGLPQGVKHAAEAPVQTLTSMATNR